MGIYIYIYITGILLHIHRILHIVLLNHTCTLMYGRLKSDQKLRIIVILGKVTAILQFIQYVEKWNRT